MSVNFFERLKVKFKAGQVVFKDGEIGTEMYIVHTGKVELTKRIGDVDHNLATLEKGDFFGEMAVLENLPRTATARAIEDSELIAINGSTFDKMIKSNIEIAVRMLRKFSVRLRAANQELENLLAERAQRPGAPPAPAVPVQAEAVPRAAVAAVPPPSAPSAGPKAVLTLKGGQRRCPILSDEVTVGRADPVTGLRPEIDLTAEDVNRFISRRHAKIVHKGGAWYMVEEVGVTNGTYLNGKRLQAGVFMPIVFGDELCFGKVFMVFEKA